MSRTISTAEETRLGALDRVLDTQEPNSTLAGELFAIVDAAQSQVALRRSFTDPSMPFEDRKGLVYQLLNGKVSGAAVYVTEEAAALRWAKPQLLLDALERQGARAELRAAMANGQLDNVEDEIFRFSRLVLSDRSLSEAINDRKVPASARVDLVTRLLDGKAHEATLVLVRRAASVTNRRFADSLEDYLNLAATLRNRGIATVRVARPLTGDQYDRLRQALSRQVGREIDMHVIVDPDVLGGVRVELGDEVIEGTVAARLNDAGRRIK